MARIHSQFYPLPWLLKFLLLYKTTEGLTCPYVFEAGRQECGYPGINKNDCESEGCCWDEDAQDTFVRCHHRECRPGYFGWGCRFRCQCEGEGEDATCDPVTGECPSGCPKSSWGVGCLLDNECTYNDQAGANYQGKLIRTSNGHICGSWSLQKAYPADHFVDGDIYKAENYCRNPKPKDYRTWCYYAFARHKKWDYCTLKQCPCPTGRFGVNCLHECHCEDPQEACHALNGTCTSGCNPRYKGANCQECADGYFGSRCDHECHCGSSTDVCNKKTGNCRWGCGAGWTGANCQTECADGYYGTKCGYQCNCRNATEVCSKETGKCLSGCKEGYSGSGCQIQCRCRDPRESCDPHNGSCRSGCSPGWAGSACHIEIPMMTRPPLKDSRTATAVQLKWRRWRKPVDGGDGPVEGYMVYFREFGEEQWHSHRTEDTRVTLNNLSEDTWYTVKVSPIHKENIEGFPSPELNISTCGPPQAGPRELRIKASSHGFSDREDITAIEEEEEEVDSNLNRYVKLLVTWKAPPIEQWGCDRLLKYRIFTRGISKGQYSFLRESDIHRIEVPDIDAYHNYSIGVSVVNSAGMESEMLTDTFIGRSGPVRHLAVVGMSPTSLGVSWSPPAHVLIPIQTYVIRYKELRIADCDVEHATWSEKILLPGHQQEYILSMLRPYTRYQVRIWGESPAGKGQTETTVGTTMAQVPTEVVTSMVRTMLKPNYSSFKWDPLECEKRMGDTVGYRYKVSNLQTGDPIIHMVNETQVTVYHLIPYSNYSFAVQFVNHIGEGPYSEPSLFTTLQGRPPAPQDVKVTVSTSSSLTVEWAPPDPPHGILTGYEVQYWCAHNLAQPTVVRNIRQTLHEYVIKNLNATTGYGVQVRAYTPVGHGEWSPVLYGYTEEARPDQPQSFTNISRSSDSLTLSWSQPKKSNGRLDNYQLQCSPVTSKTGRTLGDDTYEELPAETKNYTVHHLYPGTQYVCTLRASTRKGYGEAVRRIFWTLPKDPVAPTIPKIVDKKSTDSSLMVLLDPPQELQSSDISRSRYQIVVEKLMDKPKTEKQRLRRSAGTPCGLPPELLTSYHKALKQNLNCYIAAEFERMDYQYQEFVVGDNKTYGGYYNAPLEKGQVYDVWYGVINIVDGETAATYTKTGEPGIVGERVDPNEKSSSTMMVAGAGVAALIAIILIIIIIAVIISRRRNKKKLKAQHDLILPVKPPLDEQLDNNERPMRPPRHFELEHQHNTINIIDNNFTKLAGVPLPEDSDSTDSETDNPYSNSAIDIDLKPISIENLWNYIKEKKASRTEGFRYEYDMLPHGLKAKCEIARKPENKLKNRYGNIVAYDHSRVMLQCVNDDPHCDYINADYIDGYRKPRAFIATQGPTRHTLNDIWRMAWEQNSHRIVMVTNLVEDGRHKCEQYWPESGSQIYGDIRVEVREVEKLADYTMRAFVMSRGAEKKNLWQFHFTAWPDHGVPSYATSLLSFHKKVRSYDDVTAGPCIVHCSAGVGRTGAFISIDVLLSMARAEGKIDVFRWVQNMRKSRVNMVQTLEQYIFVYDAIFESLKCGDTSIPCVNFRRKYSDLCKLNPETDRPRLLEEYELLGVMSPAPTQSTCRDAVDPENNHKNRFKDIVPMDNLTRPYLVTYIPGSTDYINAVFSDGYKQKDAFIVTQHPLPHTTTDFWTMCYDHRCKTVVMMNEIDMKDETCQRYWPDEVGGNISCGPFRVELLSKDTSQLDIVVRDFAITLSIKNTEPHYIRHFQYRGWPRYVPVPPQKPSLLRLLGLVEKWQQRSGNNTIVVHCLNGAHQSGLFCTVSYMLERLKVEQEVDVFQSTKHTRISRPQFIPTLDQYNFLYEIAIEYMDSFDAYANFK